MSDKALPRVRGLNADQQMRLDAELTARKLTNLSQMKLRPQEVLAAWQAVLHVDAQAILAAYGDAEAKIKQQTIDAASLEAINAGAFAVETLAKARRKTFRKLTPASVTVSSTLLSSATDRIRPPIEMDKDEKEQ